MKIRDAARRLTGRSRRARQAAQVLDEVVNARAAVLPDLPLEARDVAAERLTELALFAQDYRCYAAGWISARELRRRGEATFGYLESSGSRPRAQLIDRE